ncbi:MAG: DUF4194 domain-containing protein [Puniceicoccaceae bacterium]|nr:MAG: DUF4194 domain-containing protein [Puniceicoccaceae bacterium]
MDDYFDQRINPQPDETPEPDHADIAATNPLEMPETAPGADTSTPEPIKAAAQELVRQGLVEHKLKPNIYRRLLRDQTAIASILEPLDFELRFDEPRGLAFLAIPSHAAENSDEAWQHPLVRRQRFTTEQSLLVAILRQIQMAYEQDCGIGADGARIDADELRAQLDLYLGTSGSEQRDHNRLTNLIDSLYKHGIVSRLDKENQINIRPIIVHLSNPEQLTLLLQHFRQLAETHPTAGADVSSASKEDSIDD